jgi:hypothetical protein
VQLVTARERELQIIVGERVSVGQRWNLDRARPATERLDDRGAHRPTRLRQSRERA